MLNKRGITLIEIIVSIGLISIVMIYLFNLLMDMQYEEAHSSYAKDNMVTRATIIKTVQDDFLDLNLQSIAIYNGGANITFNFQNIVKTMNITEDSISYDGEKWVIDSDNEDERYDLTHIKLNVSPSNTCSYILNVDSDGDGRCNYNCDSNNNNVLDASESSTKNESYKVCSDYQYFHLIIPVISGAQDNVIDDLDFFYIGRSS